LHQVTLIFNIVVLKIVFLRPKIHSAFIKKPIEKTKKYKEKKKLDEIFKIISAKYQLYKTLDNDKALRSNIPGVILGEPKVDENNPISRKRKMILFFALVPIKKLVFNENIRWIN
jgi:hypothetical protein